MTSLQNHNIISNTVTIDGIEYKLCKIKDRTATNIHHIISQKERQKYDVQNPINKMQVRIVRHDDFNRFFQDRQNPKKQLEYLLNEWWGNVLSLWVKRALLDILSLPDDVFYKTELIKGTKKKNRQTK